MKAKTPLVCSTLVTLGLSICIARPAVAASDQTTLTSVVNNTSCGSIGQYSLVVTGYDPGFSQGGAYTPPTLTGGQTVDALYNLTGQHGPVCPVLGGTLYIAGFSADPGASWLSSVTCNGTTLTEVAGSTNYAYDAGDGVAHWVWPKTYWNIGTGTYSCTIVHN
jgi:hypothetical protein